MFEFKAEDLKKAREIVSVLSLPENFGCDEDNDFDTFPIETQIEDVVDGDFFVTNGVSKLVILVDDLPFAIKIPFNGKYEYSWEDDSTPVWCPFYYSKSSFRDWDYCGVELEYTAEIKDNGYGMFVPNMMHLCTVCGFDVFVQEKVLPLCENKKAYGATAASRKKAEECRGIFNVDWAARAIDIYGVDNFIKFCDWANDRFPDMMADMHSGNYGYRENGDPVLLDLSGFND